VDVEMIVKRKLPGS